MSDEERIPLVEGELSGARIIHDEPGLDPNGPAGPMKGVRRKRRDPRPECRLIMVCFSPQDVSGRIEHVACPAINMSRGGFLLEYDQSIPVGTGCSISYRTISQQPVRVSGRIRHCKDIGGGRYHIGIELHRHLGREELRPAKAIPGREVAPGIRTRSLAPAVLDVGDDPEAAQPSPLTD